jgi:hypothetical protein
MPARPQSRPNGEPPRSVWVSPNRIVFSHTYFPGWRRYDLHRPKHRRKAGRRKEQA